MSEVNSNENYSLYNALSFYPSEPRAFTSLIFQEFEETMTKENVSNLYFLLSPEHCEWLTLWPAIAYYYPQNPTDWIDGSLMNYLTQNISIPLVYSNGQVSIFQFNNSISYSSAEYNAALWMNQSVNLSDIYFVTDPGSANIFNSLSGVNSHENFSLYNAISFFPSSQPTFAQLLF